MDLTSSKPTRIGAYDIVNVIGRGGMGIVYRGTDPRIGRPVAIKVLTAAADDPDLLVRFYREAKYTGSLHHQNIVTVYELGHEDGVPYLVMEYLEGVSLEGVIGAGRPMPVAEKLGIIIQVCNGLTYAHKSDLVHRDIKPANIVILGDGTAKIVDFGIALLGGSRLTRPGNVVGSLNYMSPEQLSGNVDVDLRTDVYSTGVVLFQLLTGVLPFDGGTTAATLKKIFQDPPPPLANYMKDCPPELELILGKALAKNRESRYSSPEEFATDVSRLHQHYEREILAGTLQQAADSLRNKDFTTARQLAVQVLRVAPQNVEAAELLRSVKQGQEQQQHEQQVLQLQIKAEEAFRQNRLEEALQVIEQGILLSPDGTVFPGLKDAVLLAEARSSQYRELLGRAEEALRAGNLEAAHRSVATAQEILPDDPAARNLSAQIGARLEQQLREQQAAERQRAFAVAVNSAEKAMADVRMLLYLEQLPDALQALARIEGEVAQLPPRWIEQFEALKKEVLAKKGEMDRPTAPAWGDTLGGQTAEMPALGSATVMMQSLPGEAEPIPSEAPAADVISQPEFGTAPVETTRFATSITSPDVLFPRPEVSYHSPTPEVAAELREFLQPEPSAGWRSNIWLGVAAFALVAVVVGIFMWPKSDDRSRPHPPPSVAATASYTYAEINAEPWAKVTAIAPQSGDAQSVIGETTPLRVKLPPGRYSVTLQGPNRSEKQVAITVPEQGGAICFAVFGKPDLNRLVGKE